jgi:hypothetical protein
MTEKKLEANRKNALKSTGPKTAFGKAVSSRNAVKHGVLAEAPILSGIESFKFWEKHRDGVLRFFTPVGYIEILLTIRFAVLSWRLGRVVRYESEVSTDAVEWAEADLQAPNENGYEKPEDPATAREEAHSATLVIRTLKALRGSPDEKSLDRESGAATMRAFWHELPVNIKKISIPGVPDDDDEEFDVFDGWTTGLLRKVLEVYAGESGTTTEALLTQCLRSTSRYRREAQQEELRLAERSEDWKSLVERENRRRTLLEPDVLDKLARYESYLERSMFRTLHEIQRLQASRSGVVVPPPAAVDVDVSVHPESSNGVHVQKRTRSL